MADYFTIKCIVNTSAYLNNNKKFLMFNRRAKIYLLVPEERNED